MMDVVKFRGQDYTSLRKRAQSSGNLFVDLLFPTTGNSIWLSSEGEASHEFEVVWKRPKELCKNPHLLVNNQLRPCDMGQGLLGNCWFMSACSTLCEDRKAWDRVVPNWRDQDWSEQTPEKYGGIFRFRFWVQGLTYEVVVDDRLPTVNNQLLFMKAKVGNEFWGALAEKAYAKLCGCYEAMFKGHSADALVDFTGGVSNIIDLSEGYRHEQQQKKMLFKVMQDASESGSLLCCSTFANEFDDQKPMECGLIKGRSYTIVGLQTVTMEGQQMVELLNLRNPWGRKEWNGAWADGSEEWRSISSQSKAEMKLEFAEDGDFWMCLDDWVKWFDDVSMIHVNNVPQLALGSRWYEHTFEGVWQGESAGGCVNYPDTFLNNPQYTFYVGDEKIVHISLQQNEFAPVSKNKYIRTPDNLKRIGFHVTKSEPNRKYRMHAMHERAAAVNYSNHRSVYGEFSFPPGRYIVIPTTYECELEAQFTLRIFSSSRVLCKELTQAAPSRRLCCAPCTQPNALVNVKLIGAQDLKRQDEFGAGADPYCVVHIGGDKGRSTICRDTLNPQWDTTVVLYTRNPWGKKVHIDVYSEDAYSGKDDFLGRVSVTIKGNPQLLLTDEYELPLLSKGLSSRPTQGMLQFIVSTSRDLYSI